MKLSEIKPFVRFSRRFGGGEFRRFNYPLCGCDCRLLYCCDGSGEVDIDGEKYRVKRGTLLLWRAGVPYTYFSNVEKPMLLLGVNFDYTWEHSDITLPLPPVQARLSENSFTVQAPTFEDYGRLNGVIVLQNVSESFHRRLEEINSEFERKKNCFELKCSGMLMQLLSEIVPLAENGALNSAGDKLTDKIIEYLNANYSKRFSISELGAVFGYHPNYLNQMFIKHVGKSIYAYLQDLRVTQAIYFLENSDMTVENIGVACGFSDRSHFSRYFKQKTGRTPKDFRP